MAFRSCRFDVGGDADHCCGRGVIEWRRVVSSRRYGSSRITYAGLSEQSTVSRGCWSDRERRWVARFAPRTRFVGRDVARLPVGWTKQSRSAGCCGQRAYRLGDFGGAASGASRRAIVGLNDGIGSVASDSSFRSRFHDRTMESMARDLAVHDLYFFGGRSGRTHRQCKTKTVGTGWRDHCR